jgi:L-cysteine:1D-myo-inositol 2-amino-2-deoxy-alpha-D-glucopyranoside ligase
MLHLFNTLTRRLEPFTIEGQPVTLYVCGITPYDTTHAGHAFTYSTADILVRYLEYLGNQVRYVQNVTDIDDDILKKASQVGEDWRSLGDRWTAHFIEDMLSLNMRPPERYARATGAIPEIINSVEALLKAGVAYVSNRNVYFDVSAWDEYGKLSRLNPEEMLPVANERGNNPDDPNKKDPLDFVLWQAHQPGEPYWESPWGRGRPGWHIECSTLSTCLLDETIDIHMGGGDLIFPHHESEIAQVEPVTGRPFARFWVHAAMVRYQGEKMSKSLGNLVMIRDLLKTHSADSIRLYLASQHYRDAWEFDHQRLREASQLAGRLKEAASVEADGREEMNTDGWQEKFCQAMDSNLDTPAAVDLLVEYSEAILAGASEEKNTSPAQEILREAAGVFGLRLDQPGPEERAAAGWQHHLSEFTDSSGGEKT